MTIFENVAVDYFRPYYLTQLLKTYPNIIYSDIDTIWLQDPTPYFVGDFDLWVQLDGVMTAKSIAKGYLPYFCTGFIAIRNTTASVTLLQEWIRELNEFKDPLKQKGVRFASQGFVVNECEIFISYYYFGLFLITHLSFS